MQKVSNHSIVVVDEKREKQPVIAADWFPDSAYFNLLALAKKHSGKTTVVENILNRISTPNTRYLFFVSTIDKDDTWKRIVSKYEDRAFTSSSIIDDETGVNLITQFMDDNRDPEDVDEMEVKQVTSRVKGKKVVKHIEVPVKKRKNKIQTAKFIIVLDDMGRAMRNSAVVQLLKTHRHFKATVIVSTQGMTDLEPDSIKQMDYVLLFGNINETDEKILKERLDVKISETNFMALYRNATADLYQFLYIKRIGEPEFRKGFTHRYKIPEVATNLSE